MEETITITIDKKIWKKLAQMKIDKNLRNYNEVLEILLKNKIVKEKKCHK